MVEVVNDLGVLEALQDPVAAEQRVGKVADFASSSPQELIKKSS